MIDDLISLACTIDCQSTSNVAQRLQSNIGYMLLKGQQKINRGTEKFEKILGFHCVSVPVNASWTVVSEQAVSSAKNNSDCPVAVE